MASFSRGFAFPLPRPFSSSQPGSRCLLLLVRQHAAAPAAECAAAQARLLLRARFSTSRLLQKAPLPRRPPPTAAPKPAPASGAKSLPGKATPKASPVLGAAATQAARSVFSYTEQLALKGRTLLYEAPSHFWYRFGCYMTACFCFTYSGYNYWAVHLNPNDGLMWWVPYTFAFIIVFMAAVGSWFIWSTGNIVKSIEAVPAAAVAKEIASRAAKTAANTTALSTPTAALPSPIYIEVLTRRPFPFAPPKKHLMHPDEIQLPFRMHGIHARTAREHGPPAPRTLREQREQIRAERAARDARAAERKYTMDHLLTAPFRDGAKAFGTAITGLSRAFTRSGFAKIRLGKKKYRMDAMGGWALDDGRALDRLMVAAPNAMGERH
ncbi:hypothetical protein C8A05DRAFT_35074 [Staphylotrichum tortipilum]|uniref:Uncharacterized protein n=1 Tax=Staphylotrichum tortipilum TaxID=2831512 RepID=A0AAN6RSV0_9PEZI|nr:hypothetical protein C8A05DRAFT_35074 [Staphylotrichum longicolle]